MAHPHKNLIIAWAEGKAIQSFDSGFWYDDPNPSWNPRASFRIKPGEGEFKKLKHHEVREFVNELNDVCRTFGHTGWLRAKLLDTVCKHIGHLAEPRVDGSRLE